MFRLFGRPKRAWALLFLVSLFPVAKTRAGRVESPTSLLLAKSTDGLTFRPTGETFLNHASGPDLVRLPNGDLLALFDFAGADGQLDPPVMAASRAAGGHSPTGRGRTWSAARAIRIRGSKIRSFAGRHGDLTPLGDGQWILFFAEPAKAGSRIGARRPATIIRGAVTRNGFEYAAEPRMQLRFEGLADLHPTVGRLKDELHLFVAASAPCGRISTEGAYHAVCDSRQVPARVGRIRAPGVRFVGSIIPLANGLRAYAGTEEGICSLFSEDGRNWRIEPGIRLAGAWDPAVLQLGESEFLMVYTAPLAARSETTQLVSIPPNINQDSFEEADNAVTQSAEKVSPVRGNQLAMLQASFAPFPDFQNPVDYLDWYERSILRPAGEDAYADYVALLPAGEHAETPALPSPFDDEFFAAPAPWNPASHPTWEESYHQSKALLAKFAAATRRGGYSGPSTHEIKPMDGFPDRPRLLLGLLLPHLPAHRALAKATLAAGWRMEDGRISGERMIETWRTVLEGARHLEQGPTLIEDLVAVAERGLVEETARWALKRGVFSDEELARAYETLRQLDVSAEDPAERIRGEQAFAMDMAQYLFSPPDSDGQPRLNVERARAVLKEVSGPENALDDLADMTPEDVYDTIYSWDAYYHEIAVQMSIGYPSVRAQDLDDVFENPGHGDNPLTSAFLPSWSRYHKLHARQEASRRSTQLAYATHLFKARQGRWPASLDELPDVSATIRTDPFTGTDFGYHLTENGPTIYSRSENGLDDGGIHSPRWDDRPVPTSAGADGTSDDFVFWPPVPRE